MAKFESIIKTLDEIGKVAKSRGIIHLFAEDELLNGRIITIKGKQLVNFGSCSYLGLEMDERLKAGAIDAVKKYGTQFSSSRTYVSCTNYKEFEELVAKMFDAPILLSTCSSLGHQVVMPIVMQSDDCVIFDQQAHYSMQEMIYHLKLNGTFITTLRHSRMDELENKVIEYREKYKRIWYVIDGVYSMYGDFAPVEDIIALMDKYKQLYLYADDAHGMSWGGKNGTGYFLSKTKLHPKMILATSLAKGFGSCGGVFVFPNEELRDTVKNWGGPNTHSGPQQPATVGASIASAKIHLSDEIYEFQKSLKEKIAFTNHIFDKYKLPLVSNSEGPIFFAGVGLTRMGYNMVRRMMDEGFNVNLGIFPAVPESCTGVRFTITNHIKMEDIENLAQKFAYHLPKALKEEGRAMNDIFRAFRKVANFEERIGDAYENSNTEALTFKVEQFKSIKEINSSEWDSLSGSYGACNYDNLLFLEDVFCNNSEKENNWEFFYYIIRDNSGKVILSTFFTSCFIKEDMFSPAKVSEKIEEERKKDPYYLTTKAFIMGSMLTEGQHIYIDKESPKWKQALIKLLDLIWTEQEKQEATVLMLRDFREDDLEIRSFFMDQGFVKIDIEENNLINNSEKIDSKVFFQEKLDIKKRYYFRKDILKDEDLFSVSFSPCKKEEAPIYYQLYKNVKSTKLGLNTFDLPFKLFSKMCDSENWEVIKLELTEDKKIVCVGLCEKNKRNYCTAIMGMDYSVNPSHNLYKKMLYHTICRGLELKVDNICLGLTASSAKHKLGAETIKQVAYIQMKENYIYNMALIESIKLNVS
ncbi:MAG: aminotransferase class I/II-fold pyridoxal phosphate-dependent enzyme [Bacteroidetes bacterium]|nr:aminotransferase class I/II-fold pyridoxal phosphate-dependent enzyme [Bacteroidota bacterium]